MARGGPTAVCPVGSWLQGVGLGALRYPGAATPGQTSQLRPCRRCFVLWLARGDQWITSPTCPKKYTVHEAKDVTKNRPPLASFHATLVKSHIGPTHPCFRILLPRLTSLPRLRPPLVRHYSGAMLVDLIPVTSYLSSSSPVLATSDFFLWLSEQFIRRSFAIRTIPWKPLGFFYNTMGTLGFPGDFFLDF